MKIKRCHSLRGELTVPGDKSISHRSIMLGALAQGDTKVSGFLQGADCLSSIACFRSMGVDIENHKDTVIIHGHGLHSLRAPEKVLDTVNSGTTTRLISGILSAQPFTSILNGDASIQKRPMKRIITPLSQMGAKIESLNHNDCAPLRITGAPLHGITYHSPVASAQVKSAVLLAGLYADGTTTVVEPQLSRNHSELMLKAFGASVSDTAVLSDGRASVTITPACQLYAQDIQVPGDISSAAYFLAAGLITPNSEITVKNVGINPTRDGLLKVINAMGGSIDIENQRTSGGELFADLTVRTSSLHSTVIGGAIIPTLIDELPVIAVIACFAKGTTIIKDAQELKVKESNRIDVMAKNLSLMGADITPTDDGLIIHGGKPLHGAVIDSFKDHRVAMSMTVAAMNSEGETTIIDDECTSISYPGFFEDMHRLAH